MQKDVWNNILQVTASTKPNQATKYPIQANPSSTIDIYTNIIPKKQQQLPRKPSSPLLSQYNNWLSQSLITPPAIPPMFSNPSYLPMMATAQSIANLAASYNNASLSNFPIQQLMPPITPILATQQQQQQQNLPLQTKQINQIKRKPVQRQKSLQMSTKIEQRIQRKKSSHQGLQQRHQLCEPSSPSESKPQAIIKKKVSFNDTLKVHKYEDCMGEENGKPYYYNDDISIDYNKDENYDQRRQYPNVMQPIRKYSSNTKLFDSRKPHFSPAYYRHNMVEEEDDYGHVWRRPTFLQNYN